MAVAIGGGQGEDRDVGERRSRRGQLRAWAGGAGLLGVTGLLGVVQSACGGVGTREAGGAVAERGGAGPVTVELQHRWEGARTAVVDGVIGAYEQAQPRVRVSSQLVFGNGEGFFDGMPYDKILSQISAGTPPDVIMIGSDVAAAWARRQGALRPLDEPLKRDKVEPERVFYPALAQMARARGAYQGLPQLTATDRAYLFMNKDAVDGAGLNSARGPASWEELVTWSQRLTRREGDTLAQVGLSIGGTPFIDWLARNNGKVLSDDGTRVAFDGPAGQATLEWMADATARLYGSQQAYADALRNQPTARFLGKQPLWVGQVAEFFIVLTDGPKANPAFRPAVATVPHNAQNPQARPLSLAEKIWMYAQPGGTAGPRRDAGYDLLRYLTTGEGNKAFVLAQGRPSPVVHFNDDPAFKGTNPWWDTVVKQGLSQMTPMAQTPAWNAMRGTLERMTARVLAGQQGVREALAEAARESETLLAEAAR